jgi:hypothetical protein
VLPRSQLPEPNCEEKLESRATVSRNRETE